MANNSPTIVAASLSDDQLKKSIDSLVTHVDEAMKKMVQSTNKAVGEMEAKLKSLGNIRIDTGSTSDGRSSKRAKAQNAETDAVKDSTQAYKEKTLTLDQQASAINTAIQSEKKYTDEIRNQAAAIRATKEWQEKGHFVIGDASYYNPETSKLPKKERLSLEEQILQYQNRQIEAATQQEKVQQSVTQAVAGTAKMEENVHLAQRRQNEWAAQKGLSKTTSENLSYLRTQIADLLGVQEREVKMINIEKASYDELSNYIKQLQSAYRKFGGDIAGKQGKDIADELQRAQREAQKFQQQMSRPTSLKAAMGLDEKTLDDIAYKMQRLASYRSGLDVNVRRAEIREVNAEYDRLKKKMDEVMQKNNQMVASNNALGRSWNYMKNRLAFYFTVGASTQFIKNLIEVRSQYEMNERALGILINSAERGTQIFNELSQMALVSPYTLIELSNAAKQLTAYDIAAKDVVDTTRRLADMASAVGVPMERLTYALGQIKAYGYLNSRDARMFANAGIPLVRELSKYYTELEGKMVSVGDVYDRMKKKAIDYNSVMSVVTKMTDEGGKFFDFQAKMADTLKVRLANLTLAWNNMLNEMGSETQGVLTTAIGSLRTLFAHWKDIDKLLKTIAWTFGMAKLVQVIQIANIGLAAFGKQMAWNILVGRKLSAVIFTVARSLKTLALSPITWITLLATAATAATMAIWNMNEAQESLNRSLRESAKDNYKNIEQFLENYKSIRDSLYKEEKDESTGKTTKTPIDIDRGEAKKAWEAIREQIELSSHASDEYIGKLLQVENISERVRQGFDALEEIKTVSAALKELGDDALKVDTDWSDWWNANLLPDGWVENLKDYEKELDNVRGKYEDVSKAREKWKSNKYGDAELNEDFVSLNASLVRLQNNIETTARSVYDFLQNKEWDKDINKINEVFKQVGDRMIKEGQLNPKDAFVFQTQWEVARSEASKKALELRIADEKNALQVAREENRKADVQARIDALQDELKNFDLYNGKSKAYWDNFTKWLKEQHRSEMTEMFRGMDAEQIKSINFQEGEYGSWITRMVEKYKKENKLSNDEVFQYLHHWVINANKWSIFIPLTISTEDDKTIYQQLTEADSAIDTAYKKIERLKKRRDELATKGGSLSSDKKVAEEYNKVLGEISNAQEDYNKALEKGGHSKKEDAAASKAQKAAESELQKALKDELQLIDRVRSQYKKLTDAGASDGEALVMVTNQFANSLARINSVLGKNGIPLFDISKFAGTDNPNALLDMLKLQLDSAKVAKNIKPEEIKELEVKYSEIVVDAKAYNLTKITKGLNNELDRLNEEYELAVALDADPELGSMFADWMGIDMSNLPRTAQEYADKYTSYINKYLKEKKSNIELPNLLNITDDDLRSFQEQVGEGGMTQEWVDEITKGVKAVRDVFRKEKEETSREWNALIEKYGGLQAKILKIYKDNVQQQASIVREFGTNDEQIKALDLISKIKISQDPAEIARLQEELANVMNDVTSRNPVALKTYQAVRNEQESQTGKAYWEDFKESDLYSMTFTDMANNSTQAIQMIIDKLNELKDKVKEDPASMKALIKSLEDAENELMSRDPFAGIANSIKDWTNSTKEQKEAQEELEQANLEVAGSEIALKNAQSVGDKEEIAKAEQKLVQAQQKQATVQAKVVLSGNKAKKAQEQLKNSFQNLSNELGNVSGLLGSVAQIFRAVGDDDTADAIDAINQGFTVMTTVISAVTAALIILQSSNPWLLAMAAALSVIVGLVSFLSGNSNKKITEQVEASERAVKRLELAYIDLEQAVNKAYGTAVVGAKQATLANKELQLAEIKRQIQLEKSRSGKNRDEDKIIDLQKQYKELFYEIQNGYTEIVDDLMGTDVASFAENLVSSMIDAFKQGEDYMKVFGEKFDEMVDNMIMKSIVSRVVSQYLDAIWEDLNHKINDRTKTERDELARAQLNASNVSEWSEDEIRSAIASERANGSFAQYIMELSKVTQDDIDNYKKIVNEEERAAQKRLDAASAITDSDVDYIMERVTEVMPELGEKLKNILGEYYKFGESSETQLSALQQGISGITEDTAGALEAITSGMSQQVYYQSDILTQIRDILLGGDADIQLGVQGQMLLQLQQSFQVQMAIQGILEGVLTPSGRAFSVELLS